MTFKEIKQSLKASIVDMEETENMDGEQIKTVFLGSYISLDPCGRYHHILSPNGYSARCERFWNSLERAAEELGGWIESGEGDPTDIFFSMPV